MHMVARTLAVSVVLCGMAAAAFAQNAPATRPASAGSAGQVDPQAREALEKATGLLARQETFRFAMDVNVTLGADRQDAIGYTVALDRPDRVAFRIQHGQMGTTLVATGEKLYTYLPPAGEYIVKDAPESIGQFDHETFGGVAFGLGPLVGWIVKPDPYGALLEDVQRLEYLGTDTLEEAKYHRVKVVYKPDVKLPNTTVWIAAEGQPHVRRIVPDLAEFEQRRGGGQARGTSAEAVISLHDWDLGADLPAETFAFVPPASARQVNRFFEPPPHPLIGKAAPRFTLDLLKGGQLSLAEQRGQVVLLDFWATWCGPCRISMPIIEKIAGKYEGKGLKVYTVNLRETPQQIQPFLEQSGLGLPVALDKEGRIADAYGVEGIPHTVLIGPQGQVKAVHVGATPDLEQELSREIDALLAQRDPGGSEPAATRPAGSAAAGPTATRPGAQQ